VNPAGLELSRLPTLIMASFPRRQAVDRRSDISGLSVDPTRSNTFNPLVAGATRIVIVRSV